ncbi:hypothetical protein VTN00DRAFT_6071 [Thermoascus crustaceus]|uniref:uncharacterized protein n=1 Tax=Thermoascus crustaceus TaxID=5088 RepID=UPI0037422E58
MVVEFHGRKTLCTTLVPSGPGYEHVSVLNQVCAITGARPGQLYVSGDDYLELSFSYSYSHLWRNFGICMAFFVVFVAAYAAATEFKKPPASKGEFLVFRKPNFSSARRAPGVDDLECRADKSVGVSQQEVLVDGLAKGDDAFTWKHINYISILKEKNIYSLMFKDAREAVIGVPGQALNVEQRKRTTIGLELVAKPFLLLFLDEPTSGLDTQSAWSIVKLLREIANAGQAILCTIHQPSAMLFEQFDRLLLLAKGGKTVYFGEIGPNSSTLIQYFEKNGALHVQITQIPRSTFSTRSEPERQHKPRRTGLKSGSQALNGNSSQKEIDTSSGYAMPWFQQYIAVQKHLFQQYWRSPVYILSKVFINLIGGLFLGFTFYKEPSSVAGLQNKTFSVFMLLLLSLVIIVQLQPQLIRYRELTKTYPMAGGATMWFIFMLYQMYHTSFSQSLAIVAPDAETAAMLTILFYTFILAFTGVVQPLPQLVKFWHFAYYVSPFTYLVSAMISTATHGVPVRCAESKINVFNPPDGMTCGQYFCRFSVSDVYLAGINMFYKDRWHNFGYLCAFTAFNTVLFFTAYYLNSRVGGAGILNAVSSALSLERVKRVVCRKPNSSK